MTGYLNKGLLVNNRDLSIIIFNDKNHYSISINNAKGENMLLSCDTIYIEGDFNNHDLITVQLGSLSNGLEPEDINGFSHFEIDVTINENEDPILEIKDRNYKLEDLSMELQSRIVKVADEMYNDKVKTILND